MSITDFFVTTAIILKPSSSTNSLSDSIIIYSSSTAISAIKGCLDLLSASEKESAGQFSEKASHIFITASSYDIARKDQLKINDEIYKVLFPDNPLNFDRHQEIILSFEGVDN